MTASALAQAFPVLDFDTYLQREIQSNEKHEFYYGHVYMMAGGTDNHSALAVAATIAFGRLLSSKPCYIRNSEMKIETPNSKAAFYPDLSIHCNQKPTGTATTAKSPTLILEVHSPSTRKYDLTTKRKEYFRIPSLRHYLLIDSESVQAMLYTREAGQTWPKDPLEFTDPNAAIPLTALKLNLKLKDLYRQTDLLA